jgi:hypothetical protein
MSQRRNIHVVAQSRLSFLTSSKSARLFSLPPSIPSSAVRNRFPMETPSRTLGVYTLEPPYRVCRPLGNRLPELGAIVVGDVRLGRSPCDSLAAVIARAPWCPSCALVPASMPARELIEVLDLLPRGCLKLSVENDSNPFDPGRYVAAIAGRPVPVSSEIAHYVGRRTSSGIVSPLLACFARNGVERTSRSFLSRRLKAYPPYTAHDWTAIGTLILILHSGGWAAGRLARENDLDPRTLRSWAAKYLAMRWSAAEELVGWEGILEAALRQGGYVEAPCVQPPARSRAFGA